MEPKSEKKSDALGIKPRSSQKKVEQIMVEPI